MVCTDNSLKHRSCCCNETTERLAQARVRIGALQALITEANNLAIQRMAKILDLEKAALTRWRDCKTDPPAYGVTHMLTTPLGIRPGHRLHTDIAGDWYNIVMPVSGGYKRTQEVSLWFDMGGV